MSDTRVDKQWQTQGLEGYSTAAIIGTLGHYGVVTDEAAFTQDAATRFPLAIAEGWQESWKGTGQFARFPWAAAEELWRRVSGGRLAPQAVSAALYDLLAALAKMIQGSPEAPVGKEFKRVGELKPKIPQETGKPVAAFVEEVVAHLGKTMETFNHMAEALAKEGHVDDAESFADLEEWLFPERAGVVKATVKAAGGKEAEAIIDLQKLSVDASRDPMGRMTAIDGLLSLEAFDPAAAAASALLDELEKAKSYHKAFDAIGRLAYALEKAGKGKELDALEVRARALDAAHQKVHPGHALMK